MADNSQIQLYEEEERDINYIFSFSSYFQYALQQQINESSSRCILQRSFPRAHLYNRNEEIKTENLSTAASRFALRSATELVGGKEPRPTKPAAVATHRSSLKFYLNKRTQLCQDIVGSEVRFFKRQTVKSLLLQGFLKDQFGTAQGSNSIALWQARSASL